ncbi:MAG: hypothetical protein IKL68_01355 [Clostridia bacterium]|nr:hypothetical protein [Clostridia bacterium]
MLFVIIFNLISLITVLIRTRQILSNKKRNHKAPQCIREYFCKLESKLSNLNYPYKLNKKRYLIIKYLCSTVIFLISFANYKSIKVPLILLVSVFFIPDYLIYSFTRKEKYILIGELNSIVSSLILSLTSFSSLNKSLEIAGKKIKYRRFKDAYDTFVKTYIMNGYDIKMAAKSLMNKFNSYELSLFLTTLIQGANEGELIESLERYKEILGTNYFKYLKRKAETKVLCVTLGSILSLVNLVLIVMYPIIMQVIKNLQLIFV